MNDTERVLELCVKAGEVLLQNGGEIFRVQETMTRIATAYGVKSFHVYVLSNGLFASVDEGGETHSTEIRWVPLSPVHLGRVCAVNSLSREIVAGKYTVEEAFGRLDTIQAIPCTRTLTQIAAAGVGSASFCAIFGGAAADCGVALAAGTLVWIFVLLAGRWKLSKIITNILGSALVTLCAEALFTLGLGAHIDKIIIGSIVPLLPGVPLTNSIRDFLNSDYLSGTIRLIDALLIASCIAIGVGFVLKIWALATGVGV